MKRHRNSRQRIHQAGITLLEAVTASVLIGMLAMVGSNFVSDSMILSKRATAQNYNSSSMRYAMDRMMREIREVSNTSGRISAMEAQRLVFTSASSQASGDKQTEFSYDATAKTLKMRQGSATATELAQNVNSFSFAYYDRLGLVTASKGAIQSIGITLETKDADSPAIKSSMRIFLRN